MNSEKNLEKLIPPVEQTWREEMKGYPHQLKEELKIVSWGLWAYKNQLREVIRWDKIKLANEDETKRGIMYAPKRIKTNIPGFMAVGFALDIFRIMGLAYLINLSCQEINTRSNINSEFNQQERSYVLEDSTSTSHQPLNTIYTNPTLHNQPGTSWEVPKDSYQSIDDALK